MLAQNQKGGVMIKRQEIIELAICAVAFIIGFWLMMVPMASASAQKFGVFNDRVEYTETKKIDKGAPSELPLIDGDYLESHQFFPTLGF